MTQLNFTLDGKDREDLAALLAGNAKIRIIMQSNPSATSDATETRILFCPEPEDGVWGPEVAYQMLYVRFPDDK